MVAILTLEGLEQMWKCGDMLCEHEGQGNDDTSRSQGEPGVPSRLPAERTGKKGAGVLRLKVEETLKG